jgi:hypothetical protein
MTPGSERLSIAAWSPDARQRAGARRAPPRTRRALRRCLADLAQRDYRVQAEWLRDYLHDLNEHNPGPRRHARLLETLRPQARAALGPLHKRIQAASLPLEARARTAFELEQALLAACACGYERVAAGLVGSRLPWRQAAARATQRALGLHGERLLASAQTYRALPEGFWGGVHALYARAETAGCADRRVADSGLHLSAKGEQTPTTAYKRLLLFTLAGTQGFARGDAARLYRALEVWAPDATLTREPDPDSAHPCFAVDLDSDAPPRRYTGAADAKIRILGVDDLVHRVEGLRIGRAPTTGVLAAEDELGADALGRLIEGWRPTTYPRSPRQPRGTRVDVAITLNVLHTRIDLEPHPAQDITPGEPPPEWTLEPVTDEGPGARREGVRPGVNWNPEPHAGPAGYQSARAAEAQAVRRGRDDHPLQWLLQDVSANGFCLRWDGRGSCRVGVGELAGLRLCRNNAERGRWCVGVIRRMQFLDDRRFEIGIHVLSRKPLAARVHAAPTGRGRRRPDETPGEPALVLPRSQGQEQFEILLPAHTFDEGARIRLTMHEGAFRVRLGAIREGSGAFARFALASEERETRTAAGRV